MEYSIPQDRGIECMEAIRKLLKDDFPDVQWPVEYRTLAADDVWLSTAYQRDTVTISVHQDVRLMKSPTIAHVKKCFRALAVALIGAK